MTKKYIFVAITAITLFGCSGNKQADTTKTDNTETAQAPDMHNAENALDYCGIYEGILPAADCPGIKTVLTLNKDYTFSLHSEYIDRKDAIFDDKGTFSVDGNTLTLKQDDGTTNYYKVEEGRIRMLDMDKQPITGALADHYVLKQTKVF